MGDGYQTDYNSTYKKTIQAYIQHEPHIDTPQHPKLVSEQSTSRSVPASTQPSFKTWNDLLPTPLAKGIFPLRPQNGLISLITGSECLTVGQGRPVLRLQN